jgi:hypothetical protein
MPKAHTIDPEGEVILVVTSTHFEPPPPKPPAVPIGLGAGAGAFYPLHSYNNYGRKYGDQETEDESSSQSDNDEMDSEDSEEETRIHMSAKNLILASPWFK